MSVFWVQVPDLLRVHAAPLPPPSAAQGRRRPNKVPGHKLRVALLSQRVHPRHARRVLRKAVGEHVPRRDGDVVGVVARAQALRHLAGAAGLVLGVVC